MTKKEIPYQADLIKRIKERFPDSEVLKNDPQSNFQGIPDLTVLTPDGWAMLETKRGAKSPKRQNQDYYVDWFNERGFSAFINPSNEEEVLDALSRSFETRRQSRSAESE